jgi:hypothetical protein
VSEPGAGVAVEQQAVQCLHRRRGPAVWGHGGMGLLAVAAAALRRHARDPHRPLATLGISLG